MIGSMAGARLLIGFCAVALLAPGCDKDALSTSAGTSSRSEKADSSSTREPDVREVVIAAYRGIWTAYVAAAKTSDYRTPALARHAAGNAHSLLVRGLYDNQKLGIVTKGTPTFKPQVTKLTPGDRPTIATVSDCADGSRWLNYYRSGKRVGAAPRPRRITAELRPFGSSWKVTLLVVGRCPVAVYLPWSP